MVIFENIYINIDKAILKSPEDGWQGTAAPRGSAANNECRVEEEEDLTRNPNYQLVWRRGTSELCMSRATL